MTYIVVGLGNPGEKYEHTRHSTGRIVLRYIRAAQQFPEWKSHGAGALVSRGTLAGQNALLVLPEKFMNISGVVLKKILKDEKNAVPILVYDDLDLPLGTIKLSFGRGSGGHKGVQSVIDELNTRDFFRVRVGILPTSIFGNVKKPKGEHAVEEFLLSRFSRGEERSLGNVAEDVDRALSLFIRYGKEKAMSLYSQEEEGQ